MNNKKIFITGGTGSFGKEFVKLTLKKFKPKQIIIFSRDEMKQWEMQNYYHNNSKIKFIIGDVRDESALVKSLKGIDYVVHAAATKIIPTAELNSIECIKTNTIGAINLINACLKNNIKKVVALSTDKACNPINLYGASKLASDKLFISNNDLHNSKNSKFSIVRYGNVMGSRGSIIPFLISLKNQSYIPITDKRMTRFMITLDEAVKLVWKAFDDMYGGELYIKKIPSMKIIDLAKSIYPNKKHKEIGIRIGEKLHEEMISKEDARNTYEYRDYFKILSPIYNSKILKKSIKKGKKVKEDFSYSSDNNKVWLTNSELKKWISSKFNI